MMEVRSNNSARKFGESMQSETMLIDEGNATRDVKPLPVDPNASVAENVQTLLTNFENAIYDEAAGSADVTGGTINRQIKQRQATRALTKAIRQQAKDPKMKDFLPFFAEQVKYITELAKADRDKDKVEGERSIAELKLKAMQERTADQLALKEAQLK